MRVLVAVASRHGSTADIAEEIAAALRAALRVSDPDAVVDVRAAEEVSIVDGYDAAVLGSGVYLGHWLESARTLVESHADALSRIPVWLFSSGPIGDPPMPQEDPVDVEALSRLVRVRDHQVFAGRLSKRGLRFTERAVVVALRAPEGDFRDWTAIREWAHGVGEALSGDAQATVAAACRARTVAKVPHSAPQLRNRVLVRDAVSLAGQGGRGTGEACGVLDPLCPPQTSSQRQPPRPCSPTVVSSG